MGGLPSRNKMHERNFDVEAVIQPTHGEEKTHYAVDNVIKQAPDVLRKIEEYQGCQDLARQAMGTPSYENEKAAFEGLLGAVDSISAFFEFAQQLEKIVPTLLLELANPPQDPRNLDKPALMKQLADILDFSLQFDQTRMMRPNLSNDFSYYRRLLPKFSKHPGVRVKDDDASGMALFTAEHIPMMRCLAKAGSRAMDKSDLVCTALSVLANSCLKMLREHKGSPDSNLFLVRSLTGAVVLYDHIHPQGVFNKRSPIPVGTVIGLLMRDYQSQGGLLNAIRFSSKNFKSAPDQIQGLFT